MQFKRNRNVGRYVLHEAGLTLIELMIVLVIIGVLAGVAHASYREFILRAKRAEGKAALLQLMQQQERYYSLHNSYLVFSSASTDEDERRFKWYSGERAASSAYEMVSEACPEESIRSCVRLTAKPGTSKVDMNFTDSYCGKLVVISSGVKEAEHEDCWK